MLPIWALMAASGAAGLLKSELVDKPNEEKDREMQSITDRYSPWTGMRGKAVAHSDPIGTAMAGAAQGASLGQGLEKAGSDAKLQDAITKTLGGGSETAAPPAAVADPAAQSSPHFMDTKAAYENLPSSTLPAMNGDEPSNALPTTSQKLLAEATALRKLNGYA